MIVIKEILGSDSISASRFQINANFNSIKNEFNQMQSVLGISLTAGNIDVSAQQGGQVLAKFVGTNQLSLPAAGTPTILLNGTSGSVQAQSVQALTAQFAQAQFTNGIDNQGTSNFGGTATFGGLVQLGGGLRFGRVAVGDIATATVLNTDRVVEFSCSSGQLALQADPSLLDGHVVTLVKLGTGACALDVQNIDGFLGGSVGFSTDAYKSSVTLMYRSSTNTFCIIGSSNMQFA